MNTTATSYEQKSVAIPAEEAAIAVKDLVKRYPKIVAFLIIGMRTFRRRVVS